MDQWDFYWKIHTDVVFLALVLIIMLFALICTTAMIAHQLTQLRRDLVARISVVAEVEEEPEDNGDPDHGSAGDAT